MRLEEDLVIRRSRPTMISAKYRAREERRRLLKISAGKLRRIEDPEASLCRSVLINNAVRRLQRENRDEKTRNYSGLPIVTSYLDDPSKENIIADSLMADVTDEDLSPRKRLADDSNDLLGCKRQRHDDLDLHDDVFSDFYILPPTPRLLSHIDEIHGQPEISHHHLAFSQDRLGAGMIDVRSSSGVITMSNTGTGTITAGNGGPDSDTSCCASVLFPGDLDDPSAHLSRPGVDMMEVSDVVDPDRLCDFARFADSAKTLEERLAELQSLDEHFDLTKFERNNNQSCGRAFHDIQTFHSLVPGLET